jgi:hypothetical protein
MKNETLIFDVSKALGYDLLYHPFIGVAKRDHYPLIAHLRIRTQAASKKNFYVD